MTDLDSEYSSVYASPLGPLSFRGSLISISSLWPRGGPSGTESSMLIGESEAPLLTSRNGGSHDFQDG